MAVQRNKLMRSLFLGVALFCVGSSTVWFPTAANAQLIGPCPSPLMPPPCIVFDGKRLVELSQEHAQQVQRLQEMIRHIQEAKATADGIGGSVDSVLSIRAPEMNIAPGDGSSFSTFETGGLQSAINSFSSGLYENPDAGVDAVTATRNAREKEMAAANADAIAMSVNARNFANDSHKRMVCLSRVASSSKDARGDWAVNSQVRLEILRQQAQRDQLLITVLQNASVKQTVNGQVEQGEQVVLGRTNDAPPVPARSPAWEMRDRLRDIETAIRGLTATIAIAQGIEQVRRDGRAVVERHQNAETRREQALNRFRQRAASWSGRGANTIVNATLGELNRIDTQMAALRNQPIESLSGAFQQRNIDAAALMQNDVDPRQFIGTWGDPLKNKITLDMANNLLRGQLDDYIDGDSENDEYRKLVLEYNDARLEEAWMRTYAAEVGESINAVNAVAQEESASLGYEISETAVQANLQELIAEANRLGQQIQQTGEPVPTRHAAEILGSINNLLNGQATP